MKNSGLLLALLFLPFMGYVQNGGPAEEFKLVMSPVYEFPKKHADMGYIGNTKEGILQISFNRADELFFQRFSTDKLTPTGQVKIDCSKKPDPFDTDLFSWFGGNLYMFYSTWDKAAEKEHLFADKIDLATSTFADNPKELVVADKLSGTLEILGFYKFGTTDKYNFNFSADSSKMLISYRKYNDIKDDTKSKDVLGFYVFDTDLNLIWGDEFRMPYTEKIMDNEGFAIDSKGTAYLLSKVYEGKRTEKIGDDPNYHYEVMKFGKGYTEPRQIKIKLDDKFINDLYLCENPGGEMICAGFYRSLSRIVKKGSYEEMNSDGAFLVKIDHNDSLYKIQKGYYEFPAEILMEFEKSSTVNKIEKKDEKDKAEAFRVCFREVLIGDDGSFVFIGEEYYFVERTETSSNGSVRVYTTYVYGDIYVMKIGADGEMAWTRKIPKKQQGKVGRGGLSFRYFYHNGNNYFFYLDNIKNLKLPVDQEPYKHLDGAGGYLMVCRIDEEGEMTKGKIYNVRDDELAIQPADFTWFNDNVLLGRAFNKESSKLMKIEYLK